MTSLRNAAALAALGLLAACSNTMSPSASEANRPVPGALPPSSNEGRSSEQMSAPMRNSDNKPMETRSGLNSDPANPSGAPGHPQM
jgi:hypothetical protein